MPVPGGAMATGANATPLGKLGPPGLPPIPGPKGGFEPGPPPAPGPGAGLLVPGPPPPPPVGSVGALTAAFPFAALPPPPPPPPPPLLRSLARRAGQAEAGEWMRSCLPRQRFGFPLGSFPPEPLQPST